MEKYINKINLMLSRCSCAQVNAIALLLVALIVMIDLVVGYEIAVSIFFLIPIFISAWYCGHRAGLAFTLLSASLWFFVDNVIFEHPYNNPIAPYWNGLVRLGFFLVTLELLKQLKNRLIVERNMSRTDSLTGLLSTRGFTEQAEKLFGMAARYNRPFVLAYIDLDNFKRVNDELGHSEGDKVLRVVSEQMLASLRTTDLAGRIGGDEFAIALPETGESGAKAVFETLRANVLRETQQHHWPIGLSIGVVAFDSPTCSLDEAIRFADALMYQVKASGKNNIIFGRYPEK